MGCAVWVVPWSGRGDACPFDESSWARVGGRAWVARSGGANWGQLAKKRV